MSSLIHDGIILLVALVCTAATWYYQERRSKTRENAIIAENKQLIERKQEIETTFQQEQLARQALAKLKLATEALEAAIALCGQIEIVGEAGKQVRPAIDQLEALVAKLKKTFSDTIQTHTGLLAYAEQQGTEKSDDIGSWFSKQAKAAGAGFQDFWSLIQEIEPSLKGQKFGAFKKLDRQKQETIVASAQIRFKANSSQSKNGAAAKH